MQPFSNFHEILPFYFLRYCRSSAIREVAKNKNIKVVFKSDRKTSGTGAQCTIECIDPPPPTTTVPTTISFTGLQSIFANYVCYALREGLTSLKSSRLQNLLTFAYLWLPLVTFFSLHFLTFTYLSLPFCGLTLGITWPFWALLCICLTN